MRLFGSRQSAGKVCQWTAMPFQINLPLCSNFNCSGYSSIVKKSRVFILVIRECVRRRLCGFRQDTAYWLTGRAAFGSFHRISRAGSHPHTRRPAMATGYSRHRNLSCQAEGLHRLVWSCAVLRQLCAYPFHFEPRALGERPRASYPVKHLFASKTETCPARTKLIP